jgi:hypothetical protein
MSKPFYVSASIWKGDGTSEEPEEIIEAEEVAEFNDIEGAVQFLSQMIKLGESSKVAK